MNNQMETPGTISRAGMATASASGPGWATYLLWGGLAFTGCVLSFYGDSRSLFQDESFIVWMAGSSWRHMFGAFHFEPFPPFYHICIHVWMQIFGHSEVALRSFSGVCQLASYAVILWLGRPLFRRGQLEFIFIVLVAAKVLTWSAIFGRMYELMFLESATACLAFVGVFSGRNRGWGVAIALACANLAGPMTHYFFAFLLLAQGIAFLLFYRRRSWGLFFACVVAPVALFLVIWGRMLLTQLSSGRFNAFEGGNPSKMAWWTVVLPVVDYFGVKRLLLGIPMLALVAMVGRRDGRWRLRGWDRSWSRGRRLLRDPRLSSFATLWAIPLFGIFLVAQVKQSELFKITPVSLITLMPFVALIALPVGRRQARICRVLGFGVIAFVLYTDLVGRGRVLADPSNERTGISAMLGRAHKGDVVICLVNTCTLMPYYLNDDPVGKDMSIVNFPDDLYDHPGWSNTDSHLKDTARFAAELREFSDRVTRRLRAHRGARAWLVLDVHEPKLAEALTRHLDTVLEPVDRMPMKANVITGYVVYEAKAGAGAESSPGTSGVGR